MSWYVRQRKTLDPDDEVQMDAFNEEYSNACRILEIPRDQMQVTFAQAAKYLGIAETSLRRYAYQDPPLFDLVRVPADGRRYTVDLTLDSVVEYKMLTKKYKTTN